MTPAEFKTRFPEFTAESDDRVQLFITDADPMFDVERWADHYSVGLSNFVAHGLALANYQARKQNAHNSDTLTKKVGEVQVQNDSALVNLKAKDPFMRTTYGQQYRYYQRLVGTGGLTI